MRYRSRLFIDFSLIEQNFSLLEKLCPHNEFLLMVKADAYGHGMVPITQFAINALGIKEFGCASLGEARYLREELSHLEFDIYVFSDIGLDLQSSAELYLNRRLIPVLSNMDDLDFVLKSEEFIHFPLVLKFNTGMNRLGLTEDDLDALIERLKAAGRKSIYHLMSHFANSSSLLTPYSLASTQYESFLRIKGKLLFNEIEVKRSSMANSGAIEQGLALNESHVRPGLIFYGPSSLDEPLRASSLWAKKAKNISRLETYILKVFEVREGMAIGYNATTCQKDGLMALIALGYGDGLLNSFKGAHFFFEGQRGTIFGRVNMDMTYLLFDFEAADVLKVGKKIALWDHNPSSILEFSEQVGCIPYELFCHLTSRVPRIYGVD